MSNTAIRVENLSKQYRIGGSQAPYKTLRESVVRAVQAPFRRLASVVRGQSSVVSNETIWALKDVSFRVPRGEVVGIIGRNGAGKTTLLKILSRITKPTEGRAEIHGRVGSLLEVGTGFHPELTGRENIYLNGAILGMKRAEITHRFDEIVAFAEVEKFIDTPVKHYSSGMYVRLAFAVAAHLEPEVLLVDEVLAVGDAQFQKKCLGKMGKVAKEGRTVLFVSHNMGIISNLCGSALWLENGRVMRVGEVIDVQQKYLQAISESLDTDLRHRPRVRGSGEAKVVSGHISSADQVPRTVFQCGESIQFHFDIQVEKETPPLMCAVGVQTVTGIPVLLLVETDTEGTEPIPETHNFHLICKLENVPLFPGTYRCSFWMGQSPSQDIDYVLDALEFSVEPGPGIPRSFHYNWSHGLVFFPSTWVRQRGYLSN